ncbi:hypothetical protein AAC03nite_38160 [Alicyclobacillus acidoterrestris]|nr:hypothetical protein AAC03nite_38160 [Alicyclobacillus acidoterrestris]
MSSWCVQVSSSRTHSLSRQSFSEHMYIYEELDMSEHESYYFTSVHLSNVEDPLTAWYRLRSLILILNACILLREYHSSVLLHADDLDDELAFRTIPLLAIGDLFDLRGDTPRRIFILGNKDPVLEASELANPFQRDIKVKPNENQYGKMISLTAIDDLVRETLVYCSLFKDHPLYFLVNAYKIYDNVKHDLDEIEKCGRKIPVVVQESLRRCERHKHFINTRPGSGIMARHGAVKNYKFEEHQKRPTFEEIERDFLTLVNDWVDMKLNYN